MDGGRCPFTGFALTFNCITRAHLDHMDFGLCLAAYFHPFNSTLSGGPFVVPEWRVKVNLEDGHVLLVRYLKCSCII